MWSRGEELVTDKYPEYEVLKKLLPDGTVIDGEIMPYKGNAPLSFNHLQTRIGRKNLSAKLLKEVPVAFITYDILEWKGEDIRHLPMFERRKILEEICKPDSNELKLSQLVPFSSWIKQNTVERFGPVRSVKPLLVFELAFEGIAKSSRHKSGIALRFPRIKRWRKDKPPREANTLQDLMQLLEAM